MDNQVIRKTSIEGLLMLDRPIFTDERGYFREIFHQDELERISGIKFEGIQMNHSHSDPKVIRGIHAEKWNKIVYPLNGEVFVAIADIRVDSPTFGKVETFVINDQNRHGLFIVEGLANSMCVTSEVPVDYIYLVDKYYDGSDTRAVTWDDSDLNINWPVKDPIVSDRDRNNPKLRELFPEKFK